MSNKTNIKVAKSSKNSNNDKQIAEELIEKLRSMINDRDKKCKSAKDQLISSLEITRDKYKTATGIVEGIRIMQTIDPNNDIADAITEFDVAKDFAQRMTVEIDEMIKLVNKLDYSSMNTLCDRFYDPNFINEERAYVDLCYELMRLDLCRNVGPAAEDLTSFFERTNEEIHATQKELEDLVKLHPDYAEFASEFITKE